MNIFNLGPDRSKAHDFCTGRVKSHLKTICSSAEKEQAVVPGTRTDAWGYNSKKKILYLCEIKVQHSDLYKSVVQISDAVRRFKLSPDYDRLGAVVVPIIAISNVLYTEEVKDYPGGWETFRHTCKSLNIAIWVVEQSKIHYLQGHNPTKTATKAKSVPKPATKAKAATKPKPKAKTGSKNTVRRR